MSYWLYHIQCIVYIYFGLIFDYCDVFHIHYIRISLTNNKYNTNTISCKAVLIVQKLALMAIIIPKKKYQSLLHLIILCWGGGGYQLST
jgi:hypothetical protein